MAKKPIKIKPKNVGKFNATKKATGKTTEELTHSKNPVTKKRAIFAQNAAKWNKAADGTQIPFTDEYGNLIPQDWGNNIQPNMFTDYLNNQNNDPNYTPDIQQRPQEQFTPIQPLTAQQGLPNGQLTTKPLQQPFAKNADVVNDQMKKPKLNITPFSQNKYFNRGLTYLNQAIKHGSNINNQNPDTSPDYNGLMSPISMETGGQFNNVLQGVAAITNGIQSGINFGKGTLDMIGSQLQNRQAQQLENEQYTQSVFNDALNVAPYEQLGYNTMGRNALAENGMQIKEIGGKGQPNVEVEKSEVIMLPDGFSQQIQGKKHSEGGEPLNLPSGSLVFSDKLKIETPKGKKSYSDLAKPFETKKNADLLVSKSADDIQKKTAEMMIGAKKEKLEQLFQIQEEQKMLGTHGIKIKNETLKEYSPEMAFGGNVITEKYDTILPMAQEGKKVKDKDFKSKAKKLTLEELKQKNLDFIEQEGNKFFYGKEGQINSKPGKGSPEFNAAFGEARKKGLNEFTFKGKKYGTNLYKPSTQNTGEYAFIENAPLKQLPIAEIPTKTDPTIEYRDRVEYRTPQNIIEPNLNLGIQFPNIQGRLPLNYQEIEPEYINPLYLDIQPQLNEISRNDRAIQNNLGSRGATDIANLLQSKSNSYNAQQQTFGQKYGYDRNQDAQAQQFNAQAKMNTNQYNQGSWFSQLEDPIRRREGVIDTQMKMDNTADIENMQKQQAFMNNKNYINKTFGQFQNMTPEQAVAMATLMGISQDEPKKKKEAKYGGKIKIQLKKKK